MASDPKKVKYRYCETDKVDVYLLNQVTKHVNHDELGSLARDLDVEETVYSNIAGPKDRIYKVSNRLYVFGFHFRTQTLYVLVRNNMMSKYYKHSNDGKKKEKCTMFT